MAYYSEPQHDMKPRSTSVSDAEGRLKSGAESVRKKKRKYLRKRISK